MCRDARFKYVRRAYETDELYDLANDPARDPQPHPRSRVRPRNSLACASECSRGTWKPPMWCPSPPTSATSRANLAGAPGGKAFCLPCAPHGAPSTTRQRGQRTTVRQGRQNAFPPRVLPHGPLFRRTQFFDELLRIGAFRVGTHHLVEHVGVVAHQNAPAFFAHAIQDDRGGHFRRGAGVVAEVRPICSIMASTCSSEAPSSSMPREDQRLRATSSSAGVICRSSRPVMMRLELMAMEVPMWPGITTDTFTCGRVGAEVVDERLGEALHRELGGAVGTVRAGGAERGPETVDSLRCSPCARPCSRAASA